MEAIKNIKIKFKREFDNSKIDEITSFINNINNVEDNTEFHRQMNLLYEYSHDLLSVITTWLYIITYVAIIFLFLATYLLIRNDNYHNTFVLISIIFLIISFVLKLIQKKKHKEYISGVSYIEIMRRKINK